MRDIYHFVFLKIHWASNLMTHGIIEINFAIEISIIRKILECH